MTFDEFQHMNWERCQRAFGMCRSWTPQDWALAIAGETGELCDLMKKVNRGDVSLFDEETRQKALKEIADIMTYCDLLISKLNATTGEVIQKKFDEVSARVNWPSPTRKCDELPR